MSNPWVLIPARSGSKGVPDKNMQLVGGISLIRRTVQHALMLDSSLTKVFSSDSLEYLSLAHGKPLSEDLVERLRVTGIAETSGLTLHLRPEPLGRDTSLIMDLVAKIAFDTPFLEPLDLGACLLLQPTSPFRRNDELRDFGTRLLSATDESSMVSVVDAIDDHPARMYLPSLEGGKILGRPLTDFGDCQFMPRQNLPKAYIRDGGFYIIGKDLIVRREQVGPYPELYIREYPYSLNIDTKSDLDLANLAVSRDDRIR